MAYFVTDVTGAMYTKNRSMKMSFSKILAFMAVALFSLVLIVGLFKKAFIGEKNSPITDINDPIELQLDGEYISTTTATTPFNEDIVSRPPPVAD